MRFYKQQHKYYCGIDLHARKMYVCIIDAKDKMHQNIKTDPEVFFDLIFPYLDDIAVGIECVFCWYWLADLCAEHHIRFVLGDALYMKAIHGGKTKNDRIDSYKPATLLKGGTFPIAYAYPAKWRATRDLLRRRMYLSRHWGFLHTSWAARSISCLKTKQFLLKVRFFCQPMIVFRPLPEGHPKRNNYSLLTIFRSIGVVFPLTTEGHIEVLHLIASI